MFQTVLPLYPQVKGIVHRYEELYHDEFPQISNWESFGKLVLIQLLSHHPELLSDPLSLALSYRITFAKILSLLIHTKVELS